MDKGTRMPKEPGKECKTWVVSRRSHSAGKATRAGYTGQEIEYRLNIMDSKGNSRELPNANRGERPGVDFVNPEVWIEQRAEAINDSAGIENATENTTENTTATCERQRF